MARNQEAETTVNTEAAGEATAAPAAAAASGNDDRYIMVTLDEQAAGLYTDGSKKAGDTVKRADFIRHLWAAKTHDRGAIRKEINRLNKLTGQKEIPYQIVFQATKGHAGGPDKPAEPAAPAEGAAAE